MSTLVKRLYLMNSGRPLQIKNIKPGLILAFAVVLLAFAFLLCPQAFTSYSPITASGPQLSAPSAAHWFGTDDLSRDLFARVVYGAIHSISGALMAVLFGLLVGSGFGVIAGSFGGRLDLIVMRAVDVLLSIPSLLLSLSLITILGFGVVQVALAVGITSVAGFARLSRAEVTRIRHADYVEAAFGSGGRFYQVIFRHILPNSSSTIIGYAALQFGHALLQIATLGFLGYSVQSPTPEWGLIIAEGRNYVATAWWLTVIPGLVIVALVLSANRISKLFSGRKG